MTARQSRNLARKSDKDVCTRDRRRSSTLNAVAVKKGLLCASCTGTGRRVGPATLVRREIDDMRRRMTLRWGRYGIVMRDRATKPSQ